MASIITAGTTTGTALSLTSDTSGELQIKTNNGSTTALTLTTGGNVGIGTSSPAGKLDVAGLGVFSKGSTSGITIGDVTTNSNAVLRLQGTSAGKNFQIANNLNVGGLEFTPSTADGGTTYTTPAMVISSAGNVGIGTSSPADKLVIAGGNLLFSGSNFVYSYAGGTSAQVRSGINFDGTNTKMEFYTAQAERMRIDSSGNVGIGTSSPATKLQVNGGSTTEVRLVSSGNLTSGAASLLRFGGSNSAISGYVGFGGNSSTYDLVNSLNGPMVFYTNDTERMRIDSSGNLLVGTTSATGYRLTVNNNGNGGISVQQTGAGQYSYISNAASLAGTYYHAQFLQASTPVGSITSTGSSTSYNTSSDYRLKENIAPMTGALATVQALKPVTYNWKVDGSSGQGFIAHELQEVVPDCVTGEKDAVDAEGKPVYQGIDTSFLVGVLTASIQELKAIVDAQAERIAVLESK